MEYVKARLRERDTKTVLGCAVYTVVRLFVPPEYTIIADAVAGLLGFGVMATPNK